MNEGFELHNLWNAWSKDQYKGINSQWIDPESGQRFEVQFHTRISFEIVARIRAEITGASNS